MKHVLDKSNVKQSTNALRHAYRGVQAKHPAEATLELQKRPRNEKGNAKTTKEFLRIDRGVRA